MKYLLFAFSILLLNSCTNTSTESNILLGAMHSTNDDEDQKGILDPKWYDGKAEINVYDLQQNRYNNIHAGEAVMIFVTEDFLSDKQVKNDSYTGSNSVPILKNNQIRRFTTGLYDYSIFTSVFTKSEEKSDLNTMKITTSSQDWCGQSFVQMNESSGYYRVRGFSYFEKEGDTDSKTKNVVTMDEIFNLIRIDETQLPIGDFKIIPSTIYHRLRHKELKVYGAKGIKIPYKGNLTKEDATTYVIKIPELSLEYEYIYINNDLRNIVQWKESYPSAFDGELRTTTATLKHSEWSDYWRKNNKADASLREEFKLIGGW